MSKPLFIVYCFDCWLTCKVYCYSLLVHKWSLLLSLLTHMWMERINTQRSALLIILLLLMLKYCTLPQKQQDISSQVSFLFLCMFKCISTKVQKYIQLLFMIQGYIWNKKLEIFSFFLLHVVFQAQIGFQYRYYMKIKT